MTWGLLAVAIAAYGGTTAAYTLVPSASDRFPSLLDLGLFAFYPLVYGALTLFVRRHVDGFSRTLLIDLVLGGLTVAAIGMTVVWPLVDGVVTPAVAGQMVYLLGDLGFLGLLLTAYAVAGRRAGRSLDLLAAGAFALAVTDAVWVVEVAQGAATPGPVALGWPAAMLVMACATRFEATVARSLTRPWSKVAVPGLAALACTPIVAMSAPTAPQNVLAAIALALVAARLIGSLLFNGTLLASIEQTSITDPLTGLANRPLLVDRIEQAVAGRERQGGAVAVLFIDLDDFKAINDAHGHDVGDAVLMAMAQILKRVTRGGDVVAQAPRASDRRQGHHTVGRLGGDEFVVVVGGLADPAAGAVVAERILFALRRPVDIGPYQLALSASIGVKVSSAGGQVTAAELLRDADTAMYAAKTAGRGRYEVFQDAMHTEVVARADLIRELRSAVAHGQLRVLYQPQVEVASGSMTGVEALVRWQHPVHGLLTPDRFLPVAETSGLIVAIDDWVMREACDQVRRWDAAGLPALDMAVNVSAARLTAGDLAGDVAARLRAAAIDPRRLEIEVTETVAVEHDHQAVATITAIRQQGVRVAIDDFGMGHSALSRLQTFPIDRLKIDRAFVTPLTSHGARGSIADAMIAIGQSLGLDVVAEGVETREHLHAVRALGCRSAQGYLFSKPVHADAIANLARAGVPLAPAADQPVAFDAFDFTPTPANQQRLTRTLLGELQRVTGLETTYLTRIDWDEAQQHILYARNTGSIDIPEGLSVDWASTLCRRALEQGVTYTDDVRSAFPDSNDDIGVNTFLSVPLIDANGSVQGTICGASSLNVTLGPETIQVMQRFGEIITQSAGSACLAPR
jgi:diguanylate cyclase (GGDEF)-like protein